MSAGASKAAVGMTVAGLCIGMQSVCAEPGQSFSTGVRPIGESVAVLVADGHKRSATFRSLVQALETSGWIVFVQTGSCPLTGVFGCLLHRVGTFEGHRYLRVVLVESSRTSDEMIATMGHEFQHAAEVVTDPRIKEAADIPELYRRIGYVSKRTRIGELYETRRAIATGMKILKELQSERRTAGPMRMTSR